MRDAACTPCSVYCHWVYLTLPQNLKLQLATSKIYNVKGRSGKHLSEELKIFEATGETTKNIKMLLDF